MRAHGLVFKFYQVLQKSTAYSPCAGPWHLSATFLRRMTDIGCQSRQFRQTRQADKGYVPAPTGPRRSGANKKQNRCQPVSLQSTATLAQMTFGLDVGSCARLWQARWAGMIPAANHVCPPLSFWPRTHGELLLSSRPGSMPSSLRPSHDSPPPDCCLIPQLIPDGLSGVHG